jgi:hypothetical protein
MFDVEKEAWWWGGYWATVWVWNGDRRSVTARCLRLCFHILCTTASRKLRRLLLPAQAWSGLQTALLILTKESVCCPASDLKSLGYFKICLSIPMVLCCLLCCCGRNEGIEVCIYLFLMWVSACSNLQPCVGGQRFEGNRAHKWAGCW